jgi:apolipoprotein N-acyltransferase
LGLSYFLPVLSGALLALSFPRYGHPAFAWIALVPLLIALSGWRGQPGALEGQPARRALWFGMTTGLVYFTGTVYWTSSVLAVFGGMPMVLAVLAMLLLAAYLAVFPAMTAMVLGVLIARAGRPALFFAPAAWVATEYLRGLLFGGFPWVPLGNSQVTVLAVAQVASVFGVYGLSALVALVNASVAFALLSSGRSRLTAVVATALLLVGIATWGSWRVADGTLNREGTPIRVGLIQGNVAQEDKMSPTPQTNRRIFTTYLAMTRDAVRRGAEYVIWPESSIPFTFGHDAAGDAALRDLAREVSVPILFGSEQIVANPELRMYNAAFLLGPDGETQAVYRKVHLVPFGEFFPLQEWLTFAAPLVRRFLPFTPGDGVVILPIGGHPTSTAICYEVVFPSLMRDAVLQGSQLLTTVTNDGWYGTSSAPYQHFEMAAMRAIEQGRYMARAANTGISGVVDPYGRVVQASAIFEQVGLVVEARLLTGRTIYSQIGDVIADVALALTVISLFVVRRRIQNLNRTLKPKA